MKLKKEKQQIRDLNDLDKKDDDLSDGSPPPVKKPKPEQGSTQVPTQNAVLQEQEAPKVYDSKISSLTDNPYQPKKQQKTSVTSAAASFLPQTTLAADSAAGSCYKVDSNVPPLPSSG